MEFGEAKGWRAFNLRYCRRREEWVLTGTLGMHYHDFPPSPAVCLRWALENRPCGLEMAKSFVTGSDACPQHTAAPAEECKCGYYAMTLPDHAKAYVSSPPHIDPVVWGRVAAIGLTILHEEGWRAERLTLEALYWPCMDREFTLLWDERGPVRERSYYFPPGEIRDGILGIILIEVAAKLGKRIHKIPLKEVLGGLEV